METYIVNLRFKLNFISIYIEATKKYRKVFKHVISFMTNYVLFFIFYGIVSIPFVVRAEGEKKEVYHHFSLMREEVRI